MPLKKISRKLTGAPGSFPIREIHHLTTGYRKSALKYHPDKNKDNPGAAEKFKGIVMQLNVVDSSPQDGAIDEP